MKPFKDSAEKRHIKLTILGIFVGALISIGIGVLLYILNRQNRFD